MKIILVVAGTHRQFMDGIRDEIDKRTTPNTEPKVAVSANEARIDDDRFIFVSRPDYMRGFHGVDVQFWGTYYNLSNLSEYELLADIARLP